MVLFDNIVIGQRVEVLRHGRIFLGTVRFKGFLNGTPGEWVGVELDEKGKITDDYDLPCLTFESLTR